MSPDQFNAKIENYAREIENYATSRFPAQAGNTALRFINGNFRAQGWQGNSFKSWKPNKRGGTILVNKGHLRSANYYTTQPGQATIKNTLPYAAIHNDGGTVTVPITPKMRKFFWAMYYKEGGKVKTTKRGASYMPISGGKEIRKWKSLALTKKTEFTIKIDQRQFAPTATSQSSVLYKAITRGIIRELWRIIH